MNTLAIVIIINLILSHYNTQISSSEQILICAFNNGTINFPVPCSDAVNSCSYTTYIKCSGIAPTQSITSIDLYNTQFSPMIIPSEIGNLVSLTFLRSPSACTTNGNALIIPTEIGLCTKLNQLKLNYCNPSTTPGSTLPTELGRCNLTQLTLNSFGLTGTIPTELIGNNIYLSVLTMSNNPSLTGRIPNSLSILTKLLFIDFSSTSLSGTFPSLVNVNLLQILSLSGAYFSGVLPDPQNMNNIQRYSLSNNKFTGSLPRFNIVTSSYLNIGISGNSLNGSIPNNFITLSSTTIPVDIRMNNNFFTGTIPIEFFTSMNLVALDLNHNQLSGTLVTEIALCTNLNYLNLGYNNFDGSLPTQLGGGVFSKLTVIDISYNQLSGKIPSGITLGDSVNNYYCYFNLNNNQLSGIIPGMGNNGSFISETSIDLSHNKLTIDASSFGLNAVNINWLNLASNDFSMMPRFNWSFGTTTTNSQALTTSIFTVDRFPTLISLDLSNCGMTGEMPVNLPGNFVHLNNNFFTGMVSHFAAGINNVPTFFNFILNRLDGLETTSSDIYTGINVAFLPQDIDECLLDVSECQFSCIDGWFPIPGYTCVCPVGYQLENNLRNCSPVCGDGLLSYPNEECDFVFSSFGCSFNCTQLPGYTCNASGCFTNCGDNIIVSPEECDITHPGCTSDCKVAANYSCSNNICGLCTSESFTDVILKNTNQLFPRFNEMLMNYNQSNITFPYQSCTSCQGGVSLKTRNVLASKYCSAVDTTSVDDCSFACSNLTVFSSASQALFILVSEFERNDFIGKIFQRLFSINLYIISEKKRQSDAQIILQMDSCDPQKNGEYTTFLNSLILDIVPNIPQLDIYIDPINCTFTVSSYDYGAFEPYYIAFIIIGILIITILVAAGILSIYYFTSELHSLPDEISWSFKNKLYCPWKWEYEGNRESGYYSRKYKPDGKKMRRIQNLLNTFFSNNNTLEIDEVRAIYNKALTVSFINHWHTTTTRYAMDHSQFFYTDYGNDAQKKNVISMYEKKIAGFAYKKQWDIPPLPVLHGTDLAIAEKIAQTGFASLSSLDAGFYGKGIYFTTYLLYTLPYCLMKRTPSVILSYTNMGNIYPVTEKMNGQPLKNRYNSHYVLTNKHGEIHTDATDKYICDEIVVNQEGQLLPAFIITLNIASCEKELKNWERVIADEKERGPTVIAIIMDDNII